MSVENVVIEPFKPSGEGAPSSEASSALPAAAAARGSVDEDESETDTDLPVCLNSYFH